MSLSRIVGEFKPPTKQWEMLDCPSKNVIGDLHRIFTAPKHLCLQSYYSNTMHTAHIYGWWFQPENMLRKSNYYLQRWLKIKRTLRPPPGCADFHVFRSLFFMFLFPMVKTNTIRLRDQEAMDVVHWGHLVNVLAWESLRWEKGNEKKGLLDVPTRYIIKTHKPRVTFLAY